MVLLRGVIRHGVHHPGVRVVLVVERSDPHVSQDPEVARAASHHRPEQIVIAGNPVISSPGADKLEKVLPELECLIALDLYIWQRRGRFPPAEHVSQHQARPPPRRPPERS